MSLNSRWLRKDNLERLFYRKRRNQREYNYRTKLKRLERQGKVKGMSQKIGEYGGLCNREACRKPHAVYFNRSTLKHYCQKCAEKINWFNQEPICFLEISELDLAKILHEAARAAVEARKTVAHSMLGVQPQRFIEWEEMTPEAQEGRVMQARYVLEHFNISPKNLDT